MARVIPGVRIVASFSCGAVLRADEIATATGAATAQASADEWRQPKERSMRKGFIASVAALTAGAGMALGQGAPTPPPSPPPGYPAWSGPGGPPPAGPAAGDPNAFLGGPTGYPPGPTDVPPAGEMPLYGQVAGPDAAHPANPGAQPKYGTVVGQLHKAAGGPDRWWVDVEENVWVVRSMPFAFPILTAGTVGGTGSLGEPGTRVLLGDKDLDYGEFNVFRLNLGLWDKCRVWGVELERIHFRAADAAFRRFANGRWRTH